MTYDGASKRAAARSILSANLPIHRIRPWGAGHRTAQEGTESKLQRDQLEHQLNLISRKEADIEQNAQAVKAHVEAIYRRCLQEIDEYASYKVRLGEAVAPRPPARR